MLVLKRVKRLEGKRISRSNRVMKNESRSLINKGYTKYTDYIKEADEKKEASIDFANEDVQKEVEKLISGVRVEKSKSTKDKLIFKYNGKNGSLQIKGYMLCLDLDTDDEIPPTNYPIKDKNNLSLDNLLATVKTVFDRHGKVTEAVKNYIKNEEHCLMCMDDTQCSDGSCCDNVNGDDALCSVKEPLYYILVGDKQADAPVFWNMVVGDENGYSDKSEAILEARDILRNDPDKSQHAYAVTGKVNVCYFIDNSFWDALDSEEIPVIWNSMEDQAIQDEFPDDVPTATSSDVENTSDVDYDNPVFVDVAKTKLLEKLQESLIIKDDDTPDTIMICLSPSYAINPLSDITVPLSINGRVLSMPMADMPDPEVVFDGNFTENAVSDYEGVVQDFILNDAPKSDVVELNLDNIDDAKARIVDVINSMAEDYQDNRSKLESLLDLSGDSVLKESRYYLVSKDSDPKTMEELKKITPIGFTDINIARDSMQDFSDSGKFADGLVIVDTHYSNNNEKWEIL